LLKALGSTFQPPEKGCLPRQLFRNQKLPQSDLQIQAGDENRKSSDMASTKPTGESDVDIGWQGCGLAW
jgi:hypothetical protein